MADRKLEWMYRNSSEIVDREEYLLGKPIDKAFEQSSAGNEIEKDCLPTPIFSNSSSNIQVDVIRKLKEDPLEIIRQQEIERRKQLLKNPVKLKKLQNMLKAKQSQEGSEVKRSKKKRKSSISSGDESQDIDRLLTSKYLNLMKKHGIKSLSDLSSLKIKTKKKKKKSFKKDESTDSDSDESPKRIKKSSNPKKRDTSLSSASEDKSEKKSKYSKKVKKRYSDYSDSSSTSESELEERYKNHEKFIEKHKRSWSQSSDESKKYLDHKKQRTRDHEIDQKHQKRSTNDQEDTRSDRKISKFISNNMVNKKDYRKKNDSSSLEREEKRPEYGRKKSFSKSPPTQLRKPSHFNKRFQDQSNQDKKPYRQERDRDEKSYKDKKSKGLTEEDKQKKLQEMMANAKWRDDLRVQNVSRYKEEEAAESKDKEYNEDFMRKQMAIATSSGSVESRIKSNINNIQRSKFSMSENFARR